MRPPARSFPCSRELLTAVESAKGRPKRKPDTDLFLKLHRRRDLGCVTSMRGVGLAFPLFEKPRTRALPVSSWHGEYGVPPATPRLGRRANRFRSYDAAYEKQVWRRISSFFASRRGLVDPGVEFEFADNTQSFCDPFCVWTSSRVGGGQ